MNSEEGKIGAVGLVKCLSVSSNLLNLMTPCSLDDTINIT